MKFWSLLGIATLAFSLTACSDQTSAIIGKWRTQDIGSKPEDLRSALANPQPTNNILEFTKNEFISPLGTRTSTEYEFKAPDEILVYQHVMGSRIGLSYKVIDKDVLYSKQYGRTLVYYRAK